MTIIPANAGTYLVSADYIAGERGFIFHQTVIVGWRLQHDGRDPEPITLASEEFLDSEPTVLPAILLPGGNVETYFGEQFATLEDWQNHLIEHQLPKLNARSSSGSEDF